MNVNDVMIPKNIKRDVEYFCKSWNTISNYYNKEILKIKNLFNIIDFSIIDNYCDISFIGPNKNKYSFVFNILDNKRDPFEYISNHDIDFKHYSKIYNKMIKLLDNIPYKIENLITKRGYSFEWDEDICYYSSDEYIITSGTYEIDKNNYEVEKY